MLSRAFCVWLSYSKFLRGKDLSQKTQSDLDAIIIKRKKDKPTDSNNSEAGVSGSSIQFPNTHTSSVSYQEYFAGRMAALKAARGKVGNGSSPKELGGMHPGEVLRKDAILSTVGSPHRIKCEHQDSVWPSEEPTEAHLASQWENRSETRWLAGEETERDDISSPAEAKTMTTSPAVGKRRKKVVIDSTSGVDKAKQMKKSEECRDSTGDLDGEFKEMDVTQFRKEETTNYERVQSGKKKSRGKARDMKDDKLEALRQFSEDGEPGGSDRRRKRCSKKKNDIAEEGAPLPQKSTSSVRNEEDDELEAVKEFSEDREPRGGSKPLKQCREDKKGDIVRESAVVTYPGADWNDTNGEGAKTNGKCKKRKSKKKNESEGGICEETALVPHSNLECSSAAKMGHKRAKKSRNRNKTDKTKLERVPELSSDGAELREEAGPKCRSKSKQSEVDEAELGNWECSTEHEVSCTPVTKENNEVRGKSEGLLKPGKPFKMLKHKKKPCPIVKRGALPAIKEDQASRFANSIARSQQVTNAINRHCGGDRALVELRLKNMFLREHKKSNWALIPGYGTEEWLKKCADLLALTMREQNTSPSEEDAKSLQAKDPV